MEKLESFLWSRTLVTVSQAHIALIFLEEMINSGLETVKLVKAWYQTVRLLSHSFHHYFMKWANCDWLKLIILWYTWHFNERDWNFLNLPWSDLKVKLGMLYAAMLRRNPYKWIISSLYKFYHWKTPNILMSWKPCEMKHQWGHDAIWREVCHDLEKIQDTKFFKYFH